MRFIDVTCTNTEVPEGKKLMHDTATDRRFVMADNADPAKVVDAIYEKEAKVAAEAVKESKESKAEADKAKGAK